ncbi:hypothetical protein AB0P12_02335 [Streptomyces subrutilus]|uniref:Small hydrophilic protein n=1 Tax=Streptomyces subrutilus TaxID=36818 RepID=A0A918V3Q3_9ACTN|nr:hypothetical protein [Streptomyces subrutilus]WSJ29682.1 hypothetical protein OG479_10360 [Streptomyces subrutilus]GGZ66388.1 hypothetical protein GCM10010371_27740 [Streptomyces subrutilus]
MAKNKKQNRDQQKSSAPERGAEQAKSSSATDQAEQRMAQASPSDMARKGREKRFGHN